MNFPGRNSISRLGKRLLNWFLKINSTIWENMKSQQDPTTRAVKFSPDWCKFFWAKRQNSVSLRMRWLILTFIVKFVQLGALPGNSTAATREIWLIGVVSCKRLNLLSITLQSTRKQNKIKFCTNLQSWELHRFWAVNRTVRKRLIEKK